jgi:hypothetical protein
MIEMKTETKAQYRFVKWKTAAFTALAVATLASSPALADDVFTFDLVRSPALKNFPNFVPNANGQVKITPMGPVEEMDVTVTGLPPNTDFDFFVIQTALAPFGLAWYQGDIETDGSGVGSGKFFGRFNIETFIVAPGVVNNTTIVFRNPRNPIFSDINFNPQTQPVHTWHLGLWFNSPKDAAKAGGPPTETPFNGGHNAGVQVLNTSNFPSGAGPLSRVK